MFRYMYGTCTFFLPTCSDQVHVNSPYIRAAQDVFNSYVPPEAPAQTIAVHRTASARTKDPDFGGFASSRFLILRGGSRRDRAAPRAGGSGAPAALRRRPPPGADPADTARRVSFRTHQISRCIYCMLYAKCCMLYAICKMLYARCHDMV